MDGGISCTAGGSIPTVFFCHPFPLSHIKKIGGKASLAIHRATLNVHVTFDL